MLPEFLMHFPNKISTQMNPDIHVSMLTWSTKSLDATSWKCLYFWSTYSLFPATQRAVISHNWAQPCFCVLNPVILIFSATYDYWSSLNCVLETHLCFRYPFYGDESQIFTTSQDLFVSSRSCTMPPFSSGFQPLTFCVRTCSLLSWDYSTCCSPTWKTLLSTATCSHPSAHSSGITSSGWLDYLINV